MRTALKIAAGVLGGGRAIPFPLNLFTGGTGVAIKRSGTDYILYQEFIDREAMVLGLNTGDYAGTVSCHSIKSAYTGKIIHRIDDTEGTTTGSWATTNNATYWGGSRQTATHAGDKITFTLPEYATSLYWKVATSNAGIMRVSIDGDYTTANLVTTAQQLVDSGYADAAVLVANGGTLNPTDRCFDPKTNTTPVDIPMATGLTGGEVVVLEYTGYKNPTSTATSLIVDAIGVDSPITSSNYVFNVTTENLQPLTGSVFECAHNLQPDGATGQTWVGNAHGYENQTSLTIYIDNVETVPDDGSYTVASEIRIVRVSEYFHDETGATVIANVVTTYTLKSTGLDITTVITWAVGGASGNTRSPMWPLADTIFDRGALELDAVNYTLTANNNSTVGNDLSTMVWCWDQDGTLGALLTVPAGQNGNAQIEDRSGSPTVNKIYFDRAAAALSFAANDVWTITGNYRLQRFANAETSLAK